MARNNRVGIQLRKVLQSLRPLAGIAVQNVGERIDQQIAGHYDFFLGKVNDRVAASIASSQELDLDLTVPEINAEIVIEAQRGTLEFEVLEFLSEGQAPGKRVL